MFARHHRRSIRLKNYDYSQSGIYFVTICTKNREHIFCSIENGETKLSEEGIIADKCWMEIPTHFPDVVLHEYVIMPNHIHGIIEIKKSMDVLDRDARNNVDIHNNVDAYDNVGAKNFSPLPHPPSPQPHPPSPQPHPSLSMHPSSLTNESIRPTGTSRTIGSIVRGFKIGVTKGIGYSPWQRNYYEHIIRDYLEYERIAEYIVQNPLKWENDCFYGNE